MKRLLNLFWYELKYAFRGIRKHLLLTLSAISAMAVSTLLIGCFLLIGLHVDHFATNVEQDMSVHVVLDSEISDDDQIDAVEKEIQKLSNVASVRFSSKDEELELMIQEKGEAFSLYRGEENPLSHAFFVEVKDSSAIEKTAASIEKIDGVSSVAYGGSSVTRLVDLLDMVRKIGYGVAVLLLILSLYLIYNTIRTTIYSRQDEIKIMRTVGATNPFIRIPFEVQGILIGLIGALIPFLLIFFGYPVVYEQMDGVLFASVFSLVSVTQVRWLLGLAMLGCGLVIGILASLLAVGKSLKAKR